MYKPRNFVCKHMQKSGTGAHESKAGKHQKRARLRQQFTRMLKQDDLRG